MWKGNQFIKNGTVKREVLLDLCKEVERLRAEGLTWIQIGIKTDVSKPTARKYYAMYKELGFDEMVRQIELSSKNASESISEATKRRKAGNKKELSEIYHQRLFNKVNGIRIG